MKSSKTKITLSKHVSFFLPEEPEEKQSKQTEKALEILIEKLTKDIQEKLKASPPEDGKAMSDAEIKSYVINTVIPKLESRGEINRYLEMTLKNIAELNYSKNG